jgi:hypothetical protein
MKPQEHPKKTWTTPQLTVHGTVEKLTGAIINKTAGSGDVIVIGNVNIPVPGSSVIP